MSEVNKCNWPREMIIITHKSQGELQTEYFFGEKRGQRLNLNHFSKLR